MKRLLIVGNGFDLFFNLKTDFESFFISTTKKKTNLVNQNVFFAVLNFTFFNKSYSNLFCEYLKINPENNWMDVEMVMHNFLLDTKIFNKLSNYYSNKSGQKELLLFDNSFLDFTFASILDRGTGRGSATFVSFLKKQLEQFEKELTDYLNDIDKNSKVDKSVLLNKISESAFKKCIIINFNYTNPTYKALLTNYVHGSLSRANIIIGIDVTYDDKTIKSDDERRIFTKTYRKMLLNGEDKNIDHCFDKEVKIISFYGHSLGKQDYSYFQSIFDYYRIYDSDVVLEFCYTNYNPEELGPNHELKRTIDRAYRLINDYGMTFDNKDHGKNLLHKMLLEGRVMFRKIKK